MKKLAFAGASILASAMPFVALAATDNGTLAESVQSIGYAIGLAVPIAAALVILAFFYGLAMYLFNFGEGKDDKQKQGRNLMIYSILALFVMVSIWGIVGLLQRTLGVDNTTTQQVPQLTGTENIIQ